MQCQHRGHRLDTARGPLQMPEVPLERGDRHGPRPEHRPYRARFGQIAVHRGRCVRVDMDDVDDAAPGIPQRPPQCERDPAAGGIGRGHVMRVGGQPPPGGLAVDPRPAGQRVLLGLE